MPDTTTRMGPSGRIVIPAEFRRAVGLEVGDDVVLRLEAGEIRIMGRAQAVRRAQELVRRYVSADRSLADELIADRRAESDRE